MKKQLEELDTQGTDNEEIIKKSQAIITVIDLLLKGDYLKSNPQHLPIIESWLTYESKKLQFEGYKYN